MKKCCTCNNNKDLYKFTKDKSQNDGLSRRCKECTTLKNVNVYSRRKQGIKRIKKTKEEKREYYRIWQRNRKENDPLFKFDRGVRKLIYMSFQRDSYNKLSRTASILGCSVSDFKKHIESRWENWMNWENYGKYNGQEDFGWDLDHIVPLSSAKTIEEIMKLNHYTNFQPLCSKVNRFVKADKTDYVR